MQRLYSLIKSWASCGLAFSIPFLAMSCSKPKSSDTIDQGLLLSSTQVAEFMTKNNIFYSTGYGIKDAMYACPDESWLANRFAKVILPQYLAERKSSTWVAESNDCDDFAEHAKVLMNEIHNNTKNKIPNTGILFGIVWYTRDVGGAHAINWAVVKDKYTGLPKLVFFEPQNGVGIIQLSEQEKWSISFWYVFYEEIFNDALTPNLQHRMQDSTEQSIVRRTNAV